MSGDPFGCNGNIGTSFLRGPGAPPTGCNRGPAQGTGIPLFTPETPLDVDRSYPIEVKPFEMVIIDGYNLPQNRKITVDRVVVGSFPPMTGENTNRTQMMFWRGRGPEILQHKPMDVGDPNYWQLTPEKSTLIFAIPGRYQLVLEDTDMLGQLMVVEFQVFPLLPGLPFIYWGGVPYAG